MELPVLGAQATLRSIAINWEILFWNSVPRQALTSSEWDCLPEIRGETLSLIQWKKGRMVITLSGNQWELTGLRTWISLYKRGGGPASLCFSLSPFPVLWVNFWLFSCWKQFACNPCGTELPRFLPLVISQWVLSGSLKLFLCPREWEPRGHLHSVWMWSRSAELWGWAARAAGWAGTSTKKRDRREASASLTLSLILNSPPMRLCPAYNFFHWLSS